MLDYKDVGKFTPPRERRGGRLLRYAIVLVSAAAIVVLGYAYRSHRLLIRAGNAVHAGGGNAEARACLEKVTHSWVGAGRAHAGLAMIEAMEGHRAEALAHMADARKHERRVSPIRPDDVMRACFARGEYDLALEIGKFMTESGRSDAVDFYTGAASIALGDLPGAQAALATVAPVSEFGDRSNQLRERIKELSTSGKRVVLVDRHRHPIAEKPLGDGGDLEVREPGLAALLSGDGGFFSGLDAGARRQTYVLTIDEDLQLLADAALGKYEGSLVVLDPATAEVLAYAVHPPATGTAPDFEPGSVVKVATLVTALDAGVDMGKLFPLACEGWMPVDGKQFFDWTKHGAVQDVNEALAVSCNLTFARLGLLAGRDKVRATLRSFGFDHPSLGPFHFGHIDGAAATGDLPVANLSIGLDDVAATPIQMAMLGQAIGNGGIAMRPYLVRETLSVVGERIGEGKPAPLEGDGRVASPEAIEKLILAMRGVIESEKGTGRRARVEGLSIAAKTGTAGDKTRGLDALMIGFAPVDKPVIAFGLHAAKAGKAEYEGARVIKTFLESAVARGTFPGVAPVPKEGAALDGKAAVPAPPRP